MSIAAAKVVGDIFPRRDIGIYCPVSKKECVFEWVVFRKGERSISQRGLVHGDLRLIKIYFYEALLINDLKPKIALLHPPFEC